ncbi:MAG: PfkB family carbohydrate kinase, partial [Lactococcus sp.]
PNETEAELITGIKVEDEHSLKAAADYFHNLGIEAVIITLGSKGAYYDIKDGKSGIIPAFKVAAVDTTAAGDTFIGALSTVLKADFSNIEDAILYGSKASSLTVQRYGAQPSIPYKNELD